MYRLFIRPILFLFNPEFVHKLIFTILKIGNKLPFIASFINYTCKINDPALKRTLWGLTFENPIGLAAGFDKNAECINELSNFGFSFIEIGTVTPVGQPGNPKPRLFRLQKDKGLINRMGFNNIGADKVINKLRGKRSNVIIGGNIGKNKNIDNASANEDYIACFDALFPYVDYFAVNISSPNTPNLRELQNKEPLRSLLNDLKSENAKKSIQKPILLKISPDLTISQLDDIIEIVTVTGIDGIIATNTTITRDALTASKTRLEKIGEGGLSGKPLCSKSTEIIRYIYHKTNGKLPIIGSGGVITPEDAIEKMMAGASLVQLYTGFIYEGPLIVKKMNQALLNWSKHSE